MQISIRLLQKIFLLVILLLSSFSGFSQKYYFSNYGIKEGLAHSQVKDIVQDSNGFVWIGTKVGVSKFDGEKFENYYSKDGIADNGVSTLCIDKFGNIWMGHFFGGLTIYRNGTFCEIKLDSIKNDITSIVEDNKHQIWISTNGDGVYLISDPTADKIEVSAHYSSKDNLGNIVYSMSKTESLGMLFVTRHGVKFYNKKTEDWEFVNEHFYNWPRYFTITKVLEDSKDGIWVGTFNGGLYHYKDINTEPIIYDKRDGLANNWVSELVESNDGSVWAGTWGGGITNIKDGKLLSLSVANGLSENNVKSIYVDFEGNVLIGTYSKGLSVFKSFAFIHYNKFVENGFIQVNAIYENGGSDNLWLGTNNGLYNRYLDKEGNAVIKEYLKDGIYLQSNDIRFLKSDGINLWIGTYGGGVSVLNLETKEVGYVYRINSILSQLGLGLVTAMDIDNEGHLWVGSPGGIIYYEPENETSNILTQGSNLQSNDISTIYCDSTNTVWIGHLGKGITKIKGSEIIRYDVANKYTPTVFYGTEKELFVGTESNGLHIYSDKIKTEEFSTSNGILSNMIVALNVDKHGDIYMGTNKGLCRINRQTHKIYSYGEKEGFQGVEIMHEAFFRGNDNNLWTGTSLGLTNVRTELLATDIEPPITFITDIKVNLEEIPYNENYSFKYKENAILIDYKAICIADASSIEYKVRLIGAETEWQPITKQTYSNFPALPPGEYRFEVIAKNNSGLWNEEPQSISFTINPPFWQTPWFISLALIVIVAGVVLFVKVREKALLKEKAELETKVKERTVEISQKNSLLAQKNKDITDSINYARRIQRAIMPTEAKMQELLRSSFIYYRPKDIVSGDFHWNTFYNNRLVLAAADCTGHGVPGAFMSMISISSLNKVVKEKQIVDPARILDNMRHDIVNDLKQSGEQAKDGLDIALVSIDVEKNIVHFAGAYNSMYVIRKNKIIEENLDYDFSFSVYEDYLLEVKADRMPIGISERMNRNFTTKSIQMQEGDRFYLTTDGYIDQFGGEKGKKFMSKRFKKLLLQLPKNKADNSLQILDTQFSEWRGVHEQIDDVLVIGVFF